MVLKKNNFGDKVNSFISNSGSGIKRMYHGVVDKETGEIKLIEDKPKNLYEEIQSYKEMVDINNIVRRFMNGEIDILDQVQGVYEDVSKYPKSIGEAYSIIKEQEKRFDLLPVDIRDKFDNDFNKYIVEFGTDEWINKIIEKKEVEKEVEE